MPELDNHLIGLLPPLDGARLRALGEQVDLAPFAVIDEPHRPTHHVYFPFEGCISLVTPVHGHPNLDVGMIGREGMLGAQLALGVSTTPLRALVQGAGVALRIAAPEFRSALVHSPALRKVMQRYLYVRMGELALSAACQRYHQVGPRLARWLLMTQDRAHAAQFHITHELLACLLGVRRVGVTVAAGSLQRSGLISYRRGELTVLDRSGLEAAACTCYAAERSAYAELLS